jgi:serine protease AprX
MIKILFEQRVIFVLVLFFNTLSVLSQSTQYKYWIQFTDKNNSPYSLEHPADYLSDRAIERRLKQGIPITENDLPVNPEYIDSLINLGLRVLNKSKWFNAVTVQTSDSLLIDTISKIDFVKTFENVASLTKKKSSFEKFKEVYNLYIRDKDSYSYGPSATQITMLNGHVLHESGFRGEGIHIAVIDAGFNSVHILPAFDSLWLNNQILGTRDFVDSDNEVFDAHQHGMVVLSIMGGNLPYQLIGTAPKAMFWLLRSEDTGSEFLVEEDNWITAAEFADSAGVDLINTSLGYSTFDDTTQNHSYSDMDGETARISIGAEIAASKGIIVVVSAGNEGENSWHYITAPADARNILAVGAVDSLGQYALFSSTGPSFDDRIKPNVSAMGQGTVVQIFSGGISLCNGTSCSAPIITGLAACLWQAKPSATNIEIIRAIEKSSHQYYSPDSLLGYGLPDFSLAMAILKIPTQGKTIELTKIYPNPFSDQIQISLKIFSQQDVIFELTDITGKTVLIKTYRNLDLGQYQITIQSQRAIPKGLYILRIHSGNTSLFKKLIKL